VHGQVAIASFHILSVKDTWQLDITSLPVRNTHIYVESRHYLPESACHFSA